MAVTVAPRAPRNQTMNIYLSIYLTDAEYTDDIAFHANTPTQAKSLLHSLVQAAGGIGLRRERKQNGKELYPIKMAVL